MMIINTIAHVLMFNVMFDVDGKRFFLHINAVNHFDENNSKEINALNLFIGWHSLFERS